MVQKIWAGPSPTDISRSWTAAILKEHSDLIIKVRPFLGRRNLRLHKCSARDGRLSSTNFPTHSPRSHYLLRQLRWHRESVCRQLREKGKGARLVQPRVIFSGGMNPVSPSMRRATRPLGRMTKWVMLPLLRDIRSHPSGGNCNALQTM